MKCQILFSGKNKKNNIILSSAENAQRVVKVNAECQVKEQLVPFLKSLVCEPLCRFLFKE